MLSLRIFAPRRTNHLGFTYSKEATPHVEALKQSLIGDITWEVAYRSYMIALLGESQREKDTHPEFTAHIRKLMDERILAVNTILDVLIESLTDKHYHYARLLELRRYRLDIDDAMFDTLLKSLEALKTK